jgi:peptidoglycan/xylan/chitin deacetylase (PgdA/CDA1 family)
VSPVVAFHDLGKRSPVSITGVSERQFRAHIDYLLASGGHFLSLKQWLSDPRQHHDILLTLDDAFTLQLEIAQAVLQPLGIPAVTFVVAGSVGKPALWDYTGQGRAHADWGQLSEWSRAGLEIGSHGRTHRDLRRLADAVLTEELRGSRELLEERLSVDVTAIAYPFGRSDQRVRNAAQGAGYRLGFGTRPACASLDPLNLPRTLVSGLDSPLSVAQRASPGLWGAIERGKQRIVSYCAGGTPLWQELRGDYR